MRSSPLFVLLALSLGGCGVCKGTVGTYISRQCTEQTIDDLDEDADGVSKGENDCDDADPLTGPGFEEIPYDGHDEDCEPAATGRHDLLDVDGDGYAGISQEEWEALVAEKGSGLTWPPSLKPGVDCDDNDANVKPGANDQAYDGIDADCGGDNDFDLDCDGHTIAENTKGLDLPDGESVFTKKVYEAYLERWNIDADSILCNGKVVPVVGFDDCIDTGSDAETIHPGATDEKGDGEDHDCDGDNDFDHDDDGYMPPADTPMGNRTLEDEFLDYAGKYSWTEAQKDNALYDDCLDQPAANRPGVDPAVVYPDAIDSDPYDSIDNDCDPKNTPEFDADFDGYVAATFQTEYEEYLSDWGYQDTQSSFPTYTGTPDRGDCDDTRDDIHPGALEVLGDDDDTDCHGDGLGGQKDQAPFNFPRLYAQASETYEGPRRVVVTKNNRHYIFATAVTKFAGSQPNVGLALIFDGAAPGYLQEPSPVKHFWHPFDSQRPLGQGLAMVPINDGFLVATSKVTNGRAYLILKRALYQAAQPPITYTTSTGDQVNVTADHNKGYPSIDMAVTDDDTTLWVLGTGVQDDLTEITHVATVTMSSFDLDKSWHTASAGDTCFIEPTNSVTGLATVCDDMGCSSFVADSGSIPATLVTENPQSYYGMSAHNVRHKAGDLLFLTDTIQRDEILVSTATSSVTYTVTINGTPLTYTSDADATLGEIANGIAAAITAEGTLASVLSASSDGVDTVSIDALVAGTGYTVTVDNADLMVDSLTPMTGARLWTVDDVESDLFGGRTVLDADFSWEGGLLYAAAIIDNKVELHWGDPIQTNSIDVMSAVNSTTYTITIDGIPVTYTSDADADFDEIAVGLADAINAEPNFADLVVATGDTTNDTVELAAVRGGVGYTATVAQAELEVLPGVGNSGVLEVATFDVDGDEPSRDLNLASVSVHAASDRVFIGISATNDDGSGDDALGWVFLAK